ncbi:N-acetylglucosamine kinase [Paenibacillus caseinilyticus]|nr:BadF/BadG/BcrA/BcrD ATPase family protein [Paenibacillus caseinilyticus]
MDGGGTRTRVIVADLDGHVLSYVEKGAASIYKDMRAAQHVQEAVREALAAADADPAQVLSLAAGIAGYDAEEDLEWVCRLTDADGLHCPKKHVNDAIVAHIGAFGSKPGIMVIAGTGSILLAVTEQGETIRNYDLHHYARSAARLLSYDAVYDVLAGFLDESHPEDRALASLMLSHWDVSSLRELQEKARHGFHPDARTRNRHFGDFAPAVTGAALAGSPLARQVCSRAIREIRTGIHLLSAYFEQSEVSVACIGSVARSAYFSDQLSQGLSSGTYRRLTLVEPECSPAAGAVLLALQEAGIPVTPAVKANLAASCFTPTAAL